MFTKGVGKVFGIFRVRISHFIGNMPVFSVLKWVVKIKSEFYIQTKPELKIVLWMDLAKIFDAVLNGTLRHFCGEHNWPIKDCYFRNTTTGPLKSTILVGCCFLEIRQEY